MMSRLIPRVPVNFMTSCQQIGHMTKWCVIPVRVRVVYASQTISDVWPSLQTEISEDPAVHGSTLVPILLGSDKTIASVMTGNVKYYPLYMSIRNLHNDIRHVHRGGVAAIGFLAIPTCESSVMSIGMYVNLLHFTGEKKDEKTKDFHEYKDKIFHRSMAHTLRSLKQYMTEPIVLLCADGHIKRLYSHLVLTSLFTPNES